MTARFFNTPMLRSFSALCDLCDEAVRVHRWMVQRVETGETISCAFRPKVGFGTFVDIEYADGPDAAAIHARIVSEGEEQVIRSMLADPVAYPCAWSNPWHGGNDTVYVGRDGSAILSYNEDHVALQVVCDPRDVLAAYIASLAS